MDDGNGEAFYYGPIGWILGACLSIGLLWLMFGLADPL